MIRYLTLVSMAGVLSLAMAAIAVPQEKGDAALLQGKWKVTKIIKRGNILAENRIADMSFEFSKDKLTILARGADKRDFSFKLDTTKKPKQIDLTAESGSFQGVTLGGILQINGDTLTVCIPDDDNKVRPDAFESLGGMPSRSLITLQRLKK
jgi:uncharacterized protein (TIGR03067 family)